MIKFKIKTHRNKNTHSNYWRRNGILHREDGPAVIHANDELNWFKNGVFHRIDGPAVIHGDGTHAWYQNGKLI